MKVKYLPHQPHCFAFGGFDLQMINTLDAVIKEGVDASKLDIWSRDNNFDIIHLWGVGPHNYLVIDFAKKSRKMIVATVISSYHDTLRSKLGYYYRFFQVKQLIQYYKKIDKIVVLNNEQLSVLTKYYKVSPSKIEIIPNIIENEYFKIPIFNFFEKYGVSNYVLCTGNISSRKNQHNLALACINLNLNLVLIGNVLDGETLYGEKLETLVTKNRNIVWIRELPSGSEELVSAYYNCKVYALPSKSETQPISALEAVAMHKPLILMDRKYAHQSFYKGTTLCKSPSVKDIEQALREVLNNSKIPEENKEILNCKQEKVGNMYKACYSKLLKQSW
ncbi:MAG TPA: glycosyltransferase family 4 protein [Hanamia sp.]